MPQTWWNEVAAKAPLAPDMRHLFPPQFFAYRRTSDLATHADSANMVAWMAANSLHPTGTVITMAGCRNRGANTSTFEQVNGVRLQEVGDPKWVWPSSVSAYDRASPGEEPARLCQVELPYGSAAKSDVNDLVRFPQRTIYESWKLPLLPNNTTDVRVQLVSRFERKVYDFIKWAPWSNNGYAAAHWGVYETGVNASLDRRSKNGFGGSAGKLPAFAMNLTIWDVLHFQGHWLSIHPRIYGRNFGNLSSVQSQRIGYVWPARATETTNGTVQLTSEDKHAPPHGTLFRLKASAVQHLMDNVLPLNAVQARWIVHMLRDWGMVITDRTGSINNLDVVPDDRWEASIRNTLLPALNWQSFEVVDTSPIWNEIGRWDVGTGAAGPWGSTSWNQTWGD